jgi:hypothetical protein
MLRKEFNSLIILEVNEESRIQYDDLNGEDFDNITKIRLKANDTISVGHPCVTEDGLMMVFASDMVENSLGEKSYGGGFFEA